MKHPYPVLFLLSLASLPAAEPVVRDLGVPVKSVSWVRLHPGRVPETSASKRALGDYEYGRELRGWPSLLVSMGQNNGGLFVLDVNLATGHCLQFNAPEPAQQAPTDSFRSLRTGILYVGSASDGHLLRYDPAHPERKLEDLGAIYPGHATFPTGIDEAPDGGIWIGDYPECTITRFDPATGRFTQFGSLDDTDHYVAPLCGADGTIAAVTMPVHTHLVVLDAKTGAHRPAGPVINHDDKSQYLQFYKGVDGLLYLDTHAGKFRVSGTSLVPVSYLPLQMPGIDATYRHAYQEMATMPDGLVASWDDGDNGAATFRKVLLKSTNPAVGTRTITLDWRGGGSDIFMIHRGPDGLIYGATVGPEHMFRCEPDGSSMTDLGRCSASLGEAYTMGNFSDGTMAIASYVDSSISLYDPRRPYHYGTAAGDNPRSVGSLDATGLRPVAMAIVPALTGPDGRTVPERMWIGSLPYYGTWGGTLAWLDPKTGVHASHRNIVQDCSPFSLLWLSDLKRLLVGISTEAGTGARIRAKNGALALWDPIGDRPVYIGDFGLPNMANVLALAPAGGGRVYALLGNTPYSITEMGAPPRKLMVALLDPAARKVISTAPVPADYGPLPHQGYLCLFPGPDGATYGITAHVLYRLKPGTCECQLVWRAPASDHIDAPGPWIGRTFYFSTDWRLRALTLPSGARGDLASAPSGDIEARYHSAQTLARTCKSAEALKEYLWLYGVGMKQDPSYAGVRLSFLLSSIKSLSKEYPPATEALRARRDGAANLIAADPTRRDALLEFASLNRTLGEDDRTFAVYDKLPQGDPGRPVLRIILGRTLFVQLLNARRYKEAAEAQPIDRFLMIFNAETKAFASIPTNPDFTEDIKRQPGLPGMMRHAMVKGALDEIEALAGAGKTDNARTLIERVRAFDSSKETEDALKQRLARVGQQAMADR